MQATQQALLIVGDFSAGLWALQVPAGS